jgi:hypothetical protein
MDWGPEHDSVVPPEMLLHGDPMELQPDKDYVPRHLRDPDVVFRTPAEERAIQRSLGFADEWLGPDDDPAGDTADLAAIRMYLDRRQGGLFALNEPIIEDRPQSRWHKVASSVLRLLSK